MNDYGGSLVRGSDAAKIIATLKRMLGTSRFHIAKGVREFDLVRNDEQYVRRIWIHTRHGSELLTAMNVGNGFVRICFGIPEDFAAD